MDPNPRTFSVLAGDQVTEDGLAWIEVMPTADKVRNGPWYFTVTREDLDIAAASIKENATRIPIDYDHPEDGDSTRAGGWFTGEAKVVDAGEQNPRGEVAAHTSLWAQVKWTPTGAEEVKNGDYRFLSPEWQFEDKDKKTGLLTRFKELIAATLTNRPFFKELAPVTASEEELAEYARLYGQEIADRIKAGDLTPEQAAEEHKNKTPDPDPKATTSEEENMDSEALKALGLDEDASSEEILTAVTDLKEKVAITESFDKSVLEQLTKVTAKELETERQLAKLHRETLKDREERDREDALAKAVELGKILPVHKNALRAVHAVNRDAFKEMLEASPSRSFASIGSGELGPEDRPEPRTITDQRGNAVASVEDHEWLARAAQQVLLEKGKTVKACTRDEYLDALEVARDRAAR